MKDGQEVTGQHAPELRIFRGDEGRENEDHELTPQDRQLLEEIEEFWAGRNHAMRRSARVAA